MMEMMPKYVAVTLERMSSDYDLEPVLESKQTNV
jgi:hypothetical protein